MYRFLIFINLNYIPIKKAFTKYLRNFSRFLGGWKSPFLPWHHLWMTPKFKLILVHSIRALHGSPMGDPFKNGKPMGTHWVYCKYLFSNKILSDKMQIGWKLHYFCIDSYKQHCNIGNVSRDIEGFLINPQLKCFENFLIFHGLLLWLLKKILMKIFVNRSQESLEKILIIWWPWDKIR